MTLKLNDYLSSKTPSIGTVACKLDMGLSRKKIVFFAALFLVIASVAPLAIYIENILNQSTKSRHAANDYMSNRKVLLEEDAVNRTGYRLKLSSNEKKANAILMAWKHKELDKAFSTADFIGADSFITAKSKIEQSQVFKIIKKMPKGAILHVHDLALADFHWLIKNITYLKMCYMCYDAKLQLIQFKISASKPNSTASCNWVSTPIARKQSGDPIKFDKDLYDNLTMTRGDPSKLYPTQNALWVKFGGIFGILLGLLGFEDAFSGYYTKGLEEFRDDNIQYAEVRSLLIPLYDASGNTHSDPEYALNVYKNVTEKFVKTYQKDFFGAKMIYIKTRTSSKSDIQQAVNKGIYLKKKYPEILAGFDLVGQEDTGNTLLHYINELLIPKVTGADLPYFFHAGETNWEGQTVDYNMADALLLKTQRIGHGFAFTKHNVLMKKATSMGVSAEVCPISNQILGLVSDMRNHPAAVFIDNGFPMTVNSDDPAIWGSTGLSHDFYEVFMGMTRYDDDIRVLKQLAINSIRYSSLSKEEQAKLYTMWSKKWDEFINVVITQFPSP